MRINKFIDSIETFKLLYCQQPANSIRLGGSCFHLFMRRVIAVVATVS